MTDPYANLGDVVFNAGAPTREVWDAADLCTELVFVCSCTPTMRQRGDRCEGCIADDTSFEARLLGANEQLGDAIVQIGMALGLPRPDAQNHWGPAEILARITELRTEVEARRATVTTGGPPPAIDTNWANPPSTSPSSASDPDAPALRRAKGGDLR